MTVFGIDLLAFADEHPVGAAIIAVFAVIALVLVLWILRAVWRRGGQVFRTYVAPRPTEDILTVVAASIATGVSAQGMWQFAGDVLGFSGPLKVLLFAFIEVAVITSAVRARRAMRENYAAGIDGLAVWVLTVLTAVLSTLDAKSVAEGVFRLAAPLVAAWLWERGMAIERVKLTGRHRIHWRLTPERLLVRLGLAEPTGRTASEVDAQRRLTGVALAADRAADAEPGSRTHRRWVGILKRRGRRMLALTAVSGDESQQRFLLNQLGVARSIAELAAAAPAPFWHAPVEEVAEPVLPDPELAEQPALPPVPPVEDGQAKRPNVLKWRVRQEAGVGGREIAATAYRAALKRGAKFTYADLAAIARISTRQASYAVADVKREQEEAAERELLEAEKARALVESPDPGHGRDLADPEEFNPPSETVTAPVTPAPRQPTDDELVAGLTPAEVLGGPTMTERRHAANGAAR